MTLRARPRVWALTLLACVVACASPATKTSDSPSASEEPPPRFATGGPHAEELGAAEGYPKGTHATHFRVRWHVGSFSHLDEIFRARRVHKAPTPSRLVRTAEPRITWTSGGADLTLDDYLSRNPTTGLLIARGDTYASPGFLSEDVLQLNLDVYMRVGPGGVGAVTPFNDRERPAGTKFSYASVETQVLGLVLTRATGRPVAEYLQQKIWQPIGAEADATWLVDNSGQEATYCCLNAVLRDYARLGLLLAHDGNWRGRQIIPAAWVLDATTVRMDQPHLSPGTATPHEGYGYQTWILPGERRTFMLWGANGQRVYVDPRSKLVMAHTAVRKPGLDLFSLQEMNALWMALVRQLG